MTRYVLEGEWSGYVSRQRKIVHREVVMSEWRVARLRNLHSIQYTDGTTLQLMIREALPREKVHEIKGYNSLIRKAEESGESVYVIR